MKNTLLGTSLLLIIALCSVNSAFADSIDDHIDYFLNCKNGLKNSSIYKSLENRQCGQKKGYRSSLGLLKQDGKYKCQLEITCDDNLPFHTSQLYNVCTWPANIKNPQLKSINGGVSGGNSTVSCKITDQIPSSNFNAVLIYL